MAGTMRRGHGFKILPLLVLDFIYTSPFTVLILSLRDFYILKCEHLVTRTVISYHSTMKKNNDIGSVNTFILDGETFAILCEYCNHVSRE